MVFRYCNINVSHNAEYRFATTDLLFRLRFIHCTIVSPFIARCFSLTIEKVRNHKSAVNKFNGYVNMIISEPAVKIIKLNVNIAV